MKAREEKVLSILEDFIIRHDISCVEDVSQRDSVNEECVDLVAELVDALLEC